MATLRKATQSTSEAGINDLNLSMRGTDWYQNFFKQHGLNPNQVKLNDNQRKALTALANQNGYQLGDRMKIDSAGNINQKGGFAGMPTWAKVAIASAPVAASMLVPGVREAVLSNVGGIFGGGSQAAGHTGMALAPNAVTGSIMPGGAFASSLGTAAATTAATAVPTVASRELSRVATAPGGSEMAKQGSRWGSFADKFSGRDYVNLGLGALSLLGGDEESDGAIRERLHEQFVQDLEKNKPSSFYRPSLRRPVPARVTPTAVNVPGIPFQIGGGLGEDPALRNTQETADGNKERLDALWRGEQPSAPKRTAVKRREIV